jgi:AraC-like DNA-binding protein
MNGGGLVALPINCPIVSQIRQMPDVPTYSGEHPSGDVIDRHRHDEHQLVYVSAGVVAITTGYGAWVAGADRALWIPAGTWHEHRFYGRTSFHIVSFATTESPLPAGEPTVLAVDEFVRALLIACTEPGLSTPEGQRIRAVLGDRLRRAVVQPLVLPTARDPRLADACGLVVAELHRPRSLGELARAVGTSERTLSRLFRVEFGTTYPQWRTTVRVFHAMVHLTDGATVTDTAHRCGWATTSAFVDTFARTMGQTPGTYRTTADR